jgi:hypothetical protein
VVPEFILPLPELVRVPNFSIQLHPFIIAQGPRTLQEEGFPLKIGTFEALGVPPRCMAIQENMRPLQQIRSNRELARIKQEANSQRSSIPENPASIPIAKHTKSRDRLNTTSFASTRVHSRFSIVTLDNCH